MVQSDLTKLKARNLKTSGTKAELLERLLKAVEDEVVKDEVVEDSVLEDSVFTVPTNNTYIVANSTYVYLQFQLFE